MGLKGAIGVFADYGADSRFPTRRVDPTSHRPGHAVRDVKVRELGRISVSWCDLEGSPGVAKQLPDGFAAAERVYREADVWG